jgi:hypothetical protein
LELPDASMAQAVNLVVGTQWAYGRFSVGLWSPSVYPSLNPIKR